MSQEPKHYFRNDVSVNQILDLIFNFYGKDLTAKEGWLLGNVIKYIMRYKFKDDPEQDLYKAQDYLTWLRNEQEGNVEEK